MQILATFFAVYFDFLAANEILHPLADKFSALRRIMNRTITGRLFRAPAAHLSSTYRPLLSRTYSALTTHLSRTYHALNISDFAHIVYIRSIYTVFEDA